MSPYIGLMIDVVILGALGATIFYSLNLSRQFTKLQADRKAFEQLIQALNVASARAEVAVKALREAAQGAGDSLKEKLTAARGIEGELEIMIQAGDNLAERLSRLAEKSGKAHAGETPAEDDKKPRTRAEQELLDAVKSRQK